MNISLFATTIILCASLAACDLQNKTASPLCGKYEQERPKKPPETGQAYWAIMDCTHSGAAELASGSDSADIISSAVLEICLPQVEYYAAKGQPPLVAGETREESLNELKKEIVKEARLEVLRDRAGHCDALKHSD